MNSLEWCRLSKTRDCGSYCDFGTNGGLEPALKWAILVHWRLIKIVFFNF